MEEVDPAWDPLECKCIDTQHYHSVAVSEVNLSAFILQHCFARISLQLQLFTHTFISPHAYNYTMYLTSILHFPISV